MRKFNIAEFKIYRKITNNVQKRVKFAVNELIQDSRRVIIPFTQKPLKQKLLRTASIYPKHKRLSSKEKSLYFMVKKSTAFSSNRLDFLLLKSGVFKTIFQARKFIRGGHAKVNGFTVCYPMFLLHPGQSLSFPINKEINVPYSVSSKDGVISNFKLNPRFEVSYSAGILLLNFLSKLYERKNNSF